MNFYYKEYCVSKTTGISKKEWEDFGRQSFVLLLRSFGISESINLEEFVRVFKYIELGQCEHIIQEGVENHKLYFIINGTVRYYTKVENVEMTKALLSEGNIVASTSFAKRGVSNINVITCSKLRVLYIDHDDLLLLIKNGWEEVINTTIWNMYNQGIDFSVNISTIIHLSGAEKVGRLLSLYPGIFQSFSSKHIASLLGIEPSTFSRLRANSLKIRQCGQK